MRRRKGNGCPVTGALQLVGDKWTLLLVRDLAHGARRTTELLTALQPISSRTLMARLHDMERDELITRRCCGGSPPRVEYTLTARGRCLLPLLEILRGIGETLACGDCDVRRARLGAFCKTCSRHDNHNRQQELHESGYMPRRRAELDPIVLL